MYRDGSGPVPRLSRYVALDQQRKARLATPSDATSVHPEPSPRAQANGPSNPFGRQQSWIDRPAWLPKDDPGRFGAPARRASGAGIDDELLFGAGSPPKLPQAAPPGRGIYNAAVAMKRMAQAPSLPLPHP